MKITDSIYTLSYCLVYSLASVLISSLDNLPIQLSLVITTIIAIIYFNGVNINQLTITYKKFSAHKQLWLLVNILVFVMWLFAYLGIQYSNANFFNLIFFMVLGLIAACNNKQIIKSLVIIVPLLIAALTHMQYGLGFIFAVIGGVAGYYYNVTSKKLIDKTQASATQLLAVRFFVILIVLIPFLPTHSIQLLSLHHLALLFIVAICSFIIPLYLSQKGLIKLGVKHHSALLTFTPFMTFVLQGIILNQWSILMLILSLCAPLVLYDFLFRKSVG